MESAVIFLIISIKKRPGIICTPGLSTLIPSVIVTCIDKSPLEVVTTIFSYVASTLTPVKIGIGVLLLSALDAAFNALVRESRSTVNFIVSP